MLKIFAQGLPEENRRCKLREELTTGGVDNGRSGQQEEWTMGGVDKGRCGHQELWTATVWTTEVGDMLSFFF